MLVQREVDWHDGKRLSRLLKAAKLKVAGACIEDIYWCGSRGPDRNLLAAPARCDWVRYAGTILTTGTPVPRATSDLPQRYPPKHRTCACPSLCPSDVTEGQEASICAGFRLIATSCIEVTPGCRNVQVCRARDPLSPRRSIPRMRSGAVRIP